MARSKPPPARRGATARDGVSDPDDYSGEGSRDQDDEAHGPGADDRPREEPDCGQAQEAAQAPQRHPGAVECGQLFSQLLATSALPLRHLLVISSSTLRQLISQLFVNSSSPHHHLPRLLDGLEVLDQLLVLAVDNPALLAAGHQQLGHVLHHPDLDCLLQSSHPDLKPGHGQSHHASSSTLRHLFVTSLSTLRHLFVTSSSTPRHQFYL
jgi:hypothetical protein